MHSRSRLLFLILLLAVGTLALPWAASAQEPVTSRLKLSIGGYIKPEFMYRTNAGAVAAGGVQFGVSNFGFTNTATQKNTVGGANGTGTFSAAETRLNFTLTAPDWRGIRPTAFLETDFAGDSAHVLDSYCPSLTVCAFAQNAGSPDTGAFGYNNFRMRHAWLRLAGEGLGGSWNVTFGQSWGIFGMLPYYGGSSLSFGGASVWGQRQPQLSFTHNLPLFKDFQWVNVIGVVNDTTRLNEMPAGEISSRFIWSGWQGWNGGARSPTHLGISARVQRQKADLTATPSTTSYNFTARALSATSWGYTGGIFLPILPGTSATDRTWGLSGLAEGGYGEGLNTIIPGSNPFPAAVLLGANNRADPGGVYFKPSSCSLISGADVATIASTPANTVCPTGYQPTELSLTKAAWASYNVQFYLPWGLWLSGGQKWEWMHGGDNAIARTSILVGNTWTPVVPGLTTSFTTTTNQGQFDSANGVSTCTNNGNCTNLNSGRDSVIKRLTYSYVAAFWDMTPNIRWGFEWGMGGANRKNSNQDNQSHRWQFGGYYFF